MGTTFGRYRIIAELGEGGMAHVHLAVANGPAGMGFSKLQVLKTLRSNLAEDPSFVAMFLDEARLAARISHPNVVQTNEVGRVDEKYFMAMEYLEGQALNSLIRKLKDAPDFTDFYLSALCDALLGLHAAHELRDYDGALMNLVHRDVTPHNIFVTYDGSAKVLDFGIAKAERRSVQTQTGIVKGKTAYMAPEQIIGGDIDRRVDIYAVGTMIWEAATRKRMWADVEHMTVLTKVLAGDIPRSPKAEDPTIPDELDRICFRALAPNRAERHETALELKAELEEYLESRRARMSPAKIGARVAEVYADRRAKTRQVIDSQLANLERNDPIEPVPSASLATLVGTSTGSDTDSKVTDEAPRPTVVPPTASKSKMPIFALAIVGAIAVVATISFAKLRQPTNTPPTVSSLSTTSNEGNPRQVKIVIQTTPPNAVVRVDDAPPVAAPLSLQVPLDNQEHSFRISAPDHEEVAQTIRYDGDRNLTVSLRPAPAGTKPTTPSTAFVGGRQPVPSTRTSATAPVETVAVPVPTPTVSAVPSTGRVQKNLDPNNPY